MFVIYKIKGIHLNFPKYIILLQSIRGTDNNYSYYLVSQYLNFTKISIKINLPKYLITTYLSVTILNDSKKFNLSKLGTDYIFNDTYIEECTGSYPDNYVFVNEPVWPNEEIDKINRTPLKRTIV